MTTFRCLACRHMARRLAVAWAGLGALVLLGGASAASGAEPGLERPLRVAVYDVMPYGGQGRDGLFIGATVDLWRRVAEDLHWRICRAGGGRAGDLRSTH
jgi:hypothetical protein